MENSYHIHVLSVLELFYNKNWESDVEILHRDWNL